MGKRRKAVKRESLGRKRLNPLTGEVEHISGTKAGKKRHRLPVGHPLRTHDLRMHGTSGTAERARVA